MPRRSLKTLCFACGALWHSRGQLGPRSHPQNVSFGRGTATAISSTFSMTADDAADRSVWAIDGDPHVRQYAPGEPLASPQAFLLSNPPGPYTCLRTVDHVSIGMLDFHLERLRRSAEATGLGPGGREEGFDSLAQRTRSTIARTMEAFLQENAQSEGGCPECMVTVLYAKSGAGSESGDERGYLARHGEERHGEERHDPLVARLDILAHAWPLPAALTIPTWTSSGVDVLVAGRGRTLAEAKHSSWLRERRELEEMKAQSSTSEVILTESKRTSVGRNQKLLLEGLISNLFVVEEDGCVYTAPSGVLRGSMRQLCLSACRHEGIPVRLEAPDLSRARSWKEAFLTGTGRVVAPIAAFLLPDYSNTNKAGPTSGQLGLGTTSLERIQLPSVESSVAMPEPHVSEDPSDSSFREENVAHESQRLTAGEARQQSVAQRLRHRMLTLHKQGATRLL